MSKKKVIPISNYIKLFLLVVLTILLALGLRKIYISNTNYEKSFSVIEEVLVSEINSSEVYNYIRENDNAILYIGVSDDDNCRNFENEFKSVVTSRGLENVITYLNLTNNKKRSSFIKEFNKFYDTKILGYPSIVLIRDGKVTDIVTVKTGSKLDLDDAIKFLDRNKITSDIYD